MPRKKSDLPPAVRVRENQRRSRNRRKDLVTELQARIYDYERREVQATASVQVAARRVVLQNVQLRQLLRNKGVADREIDEFLFLHPDLIGIRSWSRPTGRIQQDIQHSEASTVLVSSSQDTVQHKDLLQPPSGYSTPQGQRDFEHIVATMDTRPSSTSYKVESRGELSCARSSVSMAISNVIKCAESDAFEDDNCGQHVSLVVKSSDCFSLNVPEPRTTSSETAGFEMSCEMAANIIIGMQGDNDVEQIRARLGCNEGRDCNVKNIDVMQIMETG